MREAEGERKGWIRKKEVSRVQFQSAVSNIPTSSDMRDYDESLRNRGFAFSALIGYS
jgi:hypothetical protein